MESGYAVLLAKDRAKDNGSPKEKKPHRQTPLPVAYLQSLLKLLYVLLSGQFKFEHRLELAWRRTYLLMLRGLEMADEHREVLLLVLALAWYVAGSSLISRATFQVTIFTPETLTPPWISFVVAAQHALINCSDFLGERFAGVFAAFTAASVLMKILLVLLASLPLILIFGPMYQAATGCAWPQAYNKIHSIVNRLPGTNMVNELPNYYAFLVVNAAYFCGLFTFAVFLGIVGDELKRSFQKMRVANYPLHVREHTLVLGWSSDTISLLKQLDLGLKYSEAPNYRRPVVIMAPKDKAQMDQEIGSRLPNTKLELYTRFGNPSFPKHLAMVAAKEAHMIIVLQPEGQPSLQAIRAGRAAAAMALSITGCRNVVFQVAHSQDVPRQADFLRVLQDRCEAAAAAPAVPAATCNSSNSNSSGSSDGGRASSAVATAAGITSGPGVHLLTMPDHSFQDRITCQASVEPGMLDLWRKILQEGPNCFKLRLTPVPSGFAGCSYQEVRRSFSDCVVLGFTRQGKVHLNPVDTQLMQADDTVVVLSFVQQPRAKPWVQQVFRDAAQAAAHRVASPPTFRAGPKRIIVAGWQMSLLKDITRQFAESAPDGSTVTFLLRDVPPSPAPPKRVGACSFRYVRTDNPTSVKALLDAGIKTADSVVLTGLVPHDVSSTLEADALVLSSLLQIQTAVAASGRADSPHIITNVNHSSTRTVIQEFFSKPSQAEAPAEARARGRFTLPPAFAASAADAACWEQQPTYLHREAMNELYVDWQHQHLHQQQGQQQQQQEQEQQPQRQQQQRRQRQEDAKTGSRRAGAPEPARAAQRAKAESRGTSTTPTARVTPESMTGLSTGPIQQRGRGTLGGERGPLELGGKRGPLDDSWSEHDFFDQSVAGFFEHKAPAWLHALLRLPSAVDPLEDDNEGLSSAITPSAAAAAAGAPTAAPAPRGGQAGASQAPAPAASMASGAASKPSAGSIAPAHDVAGDTAHAARQLSRDHSRGKERGGKPHHASPASLAAVRGPNVTNPEVIMPDDVRTALLAQVASQPDIAAVVRELLTSQEGSDFYLRSPSALNIQTGETLTFAEVVETARRLRKTAVGYLLASGHLVVCMEPLAAHTFQAGDQVVLIATHQT